jgi:hypothetical protein
MTGGAIIVEGIERGEIANVVVQRKHCGRCNEIGALALAGLWGRRDERSQPTIFLSIQEPLSCQKP